MVFVFFANTVIHIWYVGHPLNLTFTKNFTEIVPGEPLPGGVKHKRGRQM